MHAKHLNLITVAILVVIQVPPEEPVTMTILSAESVTRVGAMDDRGILPALQHRKVKIQFASLKICIDRVTIHWVN